MKKTYNHIKGCILLVLMILCGMGQVWGQTTNTESWSGTVGAKTYSTANLTTIITITDDVTLTGAITVTKGEVIIQTDGTDRKISRKYASGNTFVMLKQEGGTVRLNGNGATLTIDGAARFATPFDASTEMTHPGYYNGNMIYTYDGHLYLTDVILQNGYNSDGPGAIRVGTSKITNGPFDFHLTNVIIRGFRGRVGAAILFVASDGDGDNSGNQNAILTNVEVYGCYSTGASSDGTISNYGGTIVATAKANSDVVLDNCYIHDNKANYYGAGVHWLATKTRSLLTIQNNTRICNNTAKSGGGLMIRGGTVTINSSDIYGNKASNETAGGGICVLTGTLNITNGTQIRNNTASKSDGRGGGIYLEGSSTVNFQDSYITNNQAGRGAGIYLLSDATLNLLSGSIIGNNATESGLAGGIHLASGHTYNVNVGATGSGPLIIKGNYAAGSPLDIHLQGGSTSTETPYIYVVGDNFDPQDIGIHINEGSSPYTVFYNANGDYLSDLYDAFVEGTKNFYPNVTSQRVKPYDGTNSTRKKYIYFTTDAAPSPWSAEQQEATPSDNLHLVDGVYEIYNVKDLTAFLWHVNGITTHGDFGSGDQAANGKLMANIDMDGHYWVPIGTNYTGTFDGNGYSISNLTMKGSNPSTMSGLFGSITTGAIIKNVQLHDCKFATRDAATYMGLVASQVNGGTVQNCNVDGELASYGISATVTMGGLVGKMAGGEVHSSYANPSFTNGVVMGGLVGEMTSGTNLKNSFVNAQFTPSETVTANDEMTTNRYVPVHGYYAENYNKTEFIIPATDLTELSGKTLSSMTFYLSTPAEGLWGNAIYQVFLKEVSGTTLSGFQGTSGATVVYQGKLDGRQATMTVNFFTPYTYNGGNLLVGFYEITKGSWKDCYFFGTATSGYTAVHGRSETSLDAITATTYSFLPKVTFGSNSSSLSSQGGLVGNNAGAVQNCYMLGGATSFTGEGSGTVNYCYAPSVSATGTNGTFGPVVKPYVYALVDNQVSATNSYVPTGSNKSLLQTLNNWVGSSSTYSPWVRTTTTTINGDYPVLKMNDFEAVASNGFKLYYGMATNNGLNNNMITTHTASDEAVCIYKSTNNVVSNSTSEAALYIDEDAAITQTGTITANVGVTLKNTQNSTNSWDWHMFSPALSDAPLGINYIVNGTNENVNDKAYQYAYMSDPPHYTFTGLGYFPTAADEYYREWDYYCYYEPQYHWINFKRNGISHWHEDGAHEHIDYIGDAVNVNESVMKPGKGYLLATKRETMLQAGGTLNNADISIAITTDGPYRTGYNLIGNPFQSYYDFNTFASDNASLWGGIGKASYILLSGHAYTAYAYNASNNTLTAPRWLHPHQGFMIVASNSGTATFYNSKRIVEGQSEFRSEPQPNYALINLIATDEDGNRDITTVELNRPDKGGAVKAYDLHLGKGCIYTHYEGEDYSIAFTQPGITEVGVRFEADEEATFTMTWDMENGDFSYLHLIDNKTGIDTDCLSASEYRFTASPDDYKSRFKLVFEYTGVEENNDEDEVSAGAETFAFVMGDNLVVNGEGILELFEMTGRKLLEQAVSGTQTTTTLPEMSTGVYVARLKGVKGIQTQKIVIKR